MMIMMVMDDEDCDKESEGGGLRGCCKRDSSEILAGGRVIRLPVGNYCDNNSDQQNDNTNSNSWNFRSYISAMRHICKLAQLLRFGVSPTQEWAHLVFLGVVDI